jgi:hypothetical protein
MSAIDSTEVTGSSQLGRAKGENADEVSFRNSISTAVLTRKKI